MQEQNCNNVECVTPQPQYIGVRKRKWGKWVSEIREPGKKTRIWLGSYEAPEMAAAAYDVAALHIKGPNTRLNFPELVDSFAKPTSDKAKDVQTAAQEAAKSMRVRRMELEGGGGDIPVQVRLSPSQIEAINEAPLDSPKMWMELGADNLSVSYEEIEMEEWDEMDYNYSIWD
ncbi:hypothetical protein ACJIZ3_019153 [Penstemon smallii]|uniref:AP2/ERF domain-containing protein n=1 Tax=Penstemon smallii TaxID=265156 RepID=A0ABD3T167_9LAMI